jgi:hypothetical protein
MNVYRVTQADRDLLLAGADLEAVLADREREKLEQDQRTQTRVSAEAAARLERLAPSGGEDQGDSSRPASA